MHPLITAFSRSRSHFTRNLPFTDPLIQISMVTMKPFMLAAATLALFAIILTFSAPPAEGRELLAETEVEQKTWGKSPWHTPPHHGHHGHHNGKKPFHHEGKPSHHDGKKPPHDDGRKAPHHDGKPPHHGNEKKKPYPSPPY